MDSRFLFATYAKSIPELDLNVVSTCEHCSHQQEGGMPIQANFFSLNSNYIEDLYTNITAIVSQTGWSYKDLFNLPIKKRNWIFQLIFKLDQQANEDGEEHNREIH